MHGIITLIKYHVILFIAFALLVLLCFYISEGGDLDTPLLLIVYYFISSSLAYIPLLLILTVFNFIILAAGFKAFSGYGKRAFISFLPILLFCLWFILSPINPGSDYYSLSNFQFNLIVGVWSVMVILGMIAYTGMTKYVPIALLPLAIFSTWFLLQEYNFAPSDLMLTDFQFKTLLSIWLLLNYSIFIRYRRRIMTDLIV